MYKLRVILLNLLLTTFSVTYGSSYITKKDIYLNRFQLYEVLKDKFGTQSEDILINNILKNSSIFFGPCDIYGQVYKTTKDGSSVRNIQAECFSGLSENKINVNAGANSLRKSWLLKTCIELVENDKTYAFFSTKYKIKNKKDIVRAFYDNSKTKFSAATKKILTAKVCSSSGWQKL